MRNLLDKHSFALIDGNYLGIRCAFSGTERLTNSKQIFTGGIYKFLRALWASKELGTLAVVWDGGHSSYRKSLHPDYKVKPPVTEEDKDKVQRDLDKKTTFRILGDLLPNMDIPSLRILGEEADDVIFVLCKWLVSQGKTVYAITDDSDYLQMVNHGIKVYQPIKDRLIVKENFEELIGYKSEYFTLAKAINGDGADNIPGVKGVGEVTIKKLMNSLSEPTIAGLVDYLSSQKDKRSVAMLENLKLIKRNLLLVDLNYVQLDQAQTVKSFLTAVDSCKPDAKYTFNAFQDLEFTTMGNWISYLANQQAKYSKEGVQL